MRSYNLGTIGWLSALFAVAWLFQRLLELAIEDAGAAYMVAMMLLLPIVTTLGTASSQRRQR